MAISTDAAVHFWGTETELTSGTTAGTVADGAFSDSNDTNTWTNSDDAPLAMFQLFVDDWGGAPDAGGIVNIYAQLLNFNSTNDEPQPDANYKSHYVGKFIVDNVDADQWLTAGPFALPNYETSQNYQFYIENQSGQTIGSTNNHWDFFIVPMTYGPHA